MTGCGAFKWIVMKLDTIATNLCGCKHKVIGPKILYMQYYNQMLDNQIDQ